MKIKKNSIFLMVSLLCFSTVLYSKKNNLKSLPKKYRDWLEKDVVYIISSTEKEIMLKLKSEKEWDLFIKAFWKQRDPNPNTTENEFKKEHYRRIQYANQYFGKESPGPGWRSDMGRIYIILGEPNHVEKFLNTTGLHPTIIWFYSGNAKYGLPQSFNVVFFQQGSIGEYKLYSPLKIGPARLLTNYLGDRQDHLGAYHELYEVEPTVAATSLTLLPSESSFTVSPSISSEILISTKIPVASYHHINTSYAEKILKFRGYVDVDYLENYIYSSGMVKIIRDKSGINYIHYLIEPKKLSLEQYDDHLYSNLKISGRFSDMNNQPVYQFIKKIPIKLPLSRLENIKRKLFSLQDLFPLIPGKYKYSILLMNSVEREFCSIEGNLIVPEEKGMQLSSIILANRLEKKPNFSGQFKSFFVKDIQLVPSPRNDFNSQDTLYIYFQIYRLSQTIKEKGIIKYKIMKERDNKNVFSMQKKISDYNDELNFFEKIPLKDLTYAYYTLFISIFNQDGHRVLEEQADFYISPLKLSRPWVLSLPYTDKSYATHFNIMGNQYMKKKDFKRALDLLQKAHYKKPNSVKFVLDYAKVLFMLKAYKKIEDLILPFLNGSQKSKFLFIAGETYRAKKDYQKAITYYNEYLQQLGMNTNVLNALGECHYKMGNIKKALNMFKRSLAEYPEQEKIKELISNIEGKKSNEKKGKIIQ